MREHCHGKRPWPRRPCDECLQALRCTVHPDVENGLLPDQRVPRIGGLRRARFRARQNRRQNGNKSERAANHPCLPKYFSSRRAASSSTSYAVRSRSATIDRPPSVSTCGAAARYVSADADDARIADELSALLSNAEARASLLREREAVVRRFDWSRTARETLAVLEEAALGR